MRIGVLALQGGFAAHAAALRRAAGAAAGVPGGAEIVEVRRSADLSSLDGLVLPGGESTTLLNLMRDEPWFDELRRFHEGGGAMLGTCAGAILLAREVLGPEQPSLGLLDVTVRRNAWGRQADSFEAVLELAGEGGNGDGPPLPAVFIRAPRFEKIGPGVEVLARWAGEPVLVRQGRILAATFHPELTGDARLHRQFVDLMAGQRAAATGSPVDRTGDALAAR